MIKEKTILEEAAELTSKDRQEVYGHPKDNFKRIVDLWNIYLSKASPNHMILTRRDVAMMMILTKVARDMESAVRDNLVDIVGYARTIEMLDE